MSPSCSASAARTARAIASGRSRGPGMSRAAWLIVDREHAAGALDHLARPADRRGGAPSAVADIAISRSSGRSTRCRSRHSASARSDSSERSCTSSRITAATPSSAGIGLQPADQQALGDDLDAGRRARRRHPAGCGSRPCRRRPRRAAPPCGRRRRGSRAGAAPASGCVPSPRQGASSSASGTSVVLPAPGGADQHDVAPGRERGEQRRDGIGDGQVGQHAGDPAGSLLYVHESCASVTPTSGTSWHASHAHADTMRHCLLAAVLLVIGSALPRRRPGERAGRQRARHRLAGLGHRRGRAGQPFRVGLRLRLAPGWHTYWQNPGDAGAAAGTGARPAARRHGRPDRLAGAAACRRGRADDLRLHRRPAAAGHRHARGRRCAPP